MSPVPTSRLTLKTQPNKSAAKRSGQLIGVKTLLYLVLAILTILLAVMLLSRLYNAIIGGDQTTQDAKLLASVVNGMLKDERPYLQAPLLLRVEGARIVGFSANVNSIDVAREECNPRTEQGSVGGASGASRPSTAEGSGTISITSAGCGDTACICSSTENRITDCFKLTKVRDKTVQLHSNYQGYVSCLLENSNIAPKTTELPDDIQGVYSDFVIDPNSVAYLRTADVSVNVESKERNAIIPVIIEKITKDNIVNIVISPDSDRIRGRQYYLYTCMPGDKVGCKGKTGASSFNGSHYCAPSLTTGICQQQAIAQCDAFCGTVQEPCLCGAATGEEKDGVATYGMCVKSPPGHFPINCEVVESCGDYCKQDGNEGECTGQELAACQFDGCRVAVDGRMCSVTANTGNFNTLLAMFNPAYINEQCEEIGGSGDMTRARNQC